MIDQIIYLDNAASAPLHAKAIEYLRKGFDKQFANPSAAHKLGVSMAKDIENARKEFLKSAGAQKNYQFVFTGSATESNNTIIQNFRELSSDHKVIFSKGDHPSVVEPCVFLGKMGLKTSNLPVKETGWVDEEALIELVSDKTALVVMSHVNNHNGVITDILGISQKIKEKNGKCHIHVDGVQAFGKLDLKLDGSGIDSYTISGHKMGGPKGVAGHFLSEKSNVKPLLLGGGQEDGLRASTQNYPLIMAWSATNPFVMHEKEGGYLHVGQLNSWVREYFKENSKEAIFWFNDDGRDRLSPYILTMVMPGVSSDILLRHLEELNIFVASSSACSSRAKGHNGTFSALKIPEKFHKNVLRISFGPQLTMSQIEDFCQSLASVYGELRAMLGNRC